MEEDLIYDRSLLGAEHHIGRIGNSNGLFHRPRRLGPFAACQATSRSRTAAGSWGPFCRPDQPSTVAACPQVNVDADRTPCQGAAVLSSCTAG